MARTLYLEEKKRLFAKQCFFSKPVSLHVHVFISLLKFNRSRHFTCYPSSQLTNWLDAPPEVSIASKERQHSVPGLGKAPLSSFPHIGITAGDETSTVPAAQSLVQLSTVRDRDPLGASPRPRTESLHFLDHVHSLLHAAKDNMLAIQPFCFTGADEELGSVGVGSSVGHRQDSRSGVLQLEVLIRKLQSIDRFAPSSIVVSEVSSLAHEVRDHPVESGSLVAEAWLPCAQRSEVLCSLWHNFGVELEGYPPEGLVVGSNVKINRGVLVGGCGAAAAHARRDKRQRT